MSETDRPLVLPPLRRTANDAMKFAHVAHSGQMDKAGRAYTGHITGVVVRLLKLLNCVPLNEWDEILQIAYLHDVVEDTSYTLDDILREGFTEEVVFAVERLTKPDAETAWKYNFWIEMLADLGSLPVILVKIADIEDNSDPERLALLDEPTRERLSAKYGAALPILKEAAARLGWRKG